MGTDEPHDPDRSGMDRSMIRWMLRLTPNERVQYSVAAGELVKALRKGLQEAERRKAHRRARR